MILSLKKEATNLQQLVEQGTALTQGHHMTLTQLNEEKRQLLKDQEDLRIRIDTLDKDVRETAEKEKKLDSENTSKQDECKRLQEKMSVMKREYDREVKSKDRAEGQCRELMSVLQVRTNDIEQRAKAIKRYDEAITKLSEDYAADSAQSHKLGAQYEEKKVQLVDAKKSYEDFVQTMAQYNQRISELEEASKQKEIQIISFRHEEQKFIKKKDQRLKDTRRVVQNRDDIKKEQDMLIRQEQQLAKEFTGMERDEAAREASLKKEEAHYQMLAKGVDREKEKQLLVLAGIKTEGETMGRLEQAVGGEQDVGTRLKTGILQLEQDRERFAEEASQADIKCQKASQEVKIGLMRIDDIQKQIEDAEKRLSEQQHLYEQVRSDRNLYSKRLIESQDQISELKQKFKIMDHQIDQLKEELAMKEKKYFEEQARQKTENEKLLKIQKTCNEYKANLAACETRTSTLEQEIKQMTKVINQCDSELSGQQQQFLTVTNERDILGTQLIRRNDELALLYEKLRIQQQTANKGEMQYRDRVTDIRMLKLKINELKRNIHMAQVRVKNIDDIKSHIITLQRQLTLERTKVQALSEELENPQNDLRWRKLDGEDLKDNEMIHKIQMLQKRLIAKTEESVEKDIITSEMDKLYVELRAILARQPGPEVAEQLNAYQQELRRKNMAMKSVASELNMSATHMSEAKYEIERLARELQEVKKMYFDLKINNQLYTSQANRTWAGASSTNDAAPAAEPRLNETM
eukprot:GILI01007291.1.p1 GENE.GILI01007291.1~~GILI01007291.1.p1  ORF type:complete len:807 (-),score=159.60 GILI01007291.1:59-2302(-)